MHVDNNHSCGVRARFALTMGALAVVALLVPSAAGAATMHGTSSVAPFRFGGIPSTTLLKETPKTSQLSLSAWNDSVGGRYTAASSVQPAATVAYDVTGVWYWFGSYLNVNGLVWSSYSMTPGSTTGPVYVHVVARLAGGGIIAEDTVPAEGYSFTPDDIPTFTALFNLPDYAGESLVVTAEAAGTQPSANQQTVVLSPENRSMTVDPNGWRSYTCSFRNNSPYTVEKPVAGGWETDPECGDAGGLIDTLFAFDGAIKIAPGAVWVTELDGFAPWSSAADVVTYAQALPVTAPAYVPQNVYRFFNLRAGVHFYTASEAEKQNVIDTLGGVYRFEGPSYAINLANPNNTLPVYRFFNTKAGVHFYTASAVERDNVINTLGGTYRYEGPSYNVSTTSNNAFPVYRFYNLAQGVHFYTASEAEKQNVIDTLGGVYRFEGISYWVGR